MPARPRLAPGTSIIIIIATTTSHHWPRHQPSPPIAHHLGKSAAAAGLGPTNQQQQHAGCGDNHRQSPPALTWQLTAPACRRAQHRRHIHRPPIRITHRTHRRNNSHAWHHRSPRHHHFTGKSGQHARTHKRLAHANLHTCTRTFRPRPPVAAATAQSRTINRTYLSPDNHRQSTPADTPGTTSRQLHRRSHAHRHPLPHLPGHAPLLSHNQSRVPRAPRHPYRRPCRHLSPAPAPRQVGLGRRLH